MSWKDLSPEHRWILEQQLTNPQLDVLILHLAGCSQRRTATMLGISRWAVRDRLAYGLDALAQLDRKDAA